MTASCPAEYIAIAETLADAARPIAQRYFRAGIPIEAKADDSPVTKADREIETALREILADTCPGHGVVGEEMGGVPDGDGPLWVLDPIDGTKAFVTGMPVFGTLIALAIESRFVLGVIDQPISGERWLGAAGRTTEFNGTNSRVSGCDTLAAARLFTTSPEYYGRAGLLDAFDRLRQQVLITRYGADCYAFGLLASGHADIVVEADMNLWDYAALVPVVEGAGGVMTDWQGNPLRAEGNAHVIASAKADLHAEALRCLNTENC